MSFPRYKKYKPSGVEWLGDVPESWAVRKIRWLFEIKKRIAGELGFDVFSITQQGIRIRDPESNDGQISMDYSKYQLVEVGDFAMNHMDLLTGGVDIAATRGVTSPDYRVVAIRDHYTSHDKFFLYLFQMCYRNRIFYGFGQGSSQLGRWRLPTEEFIDFVFPFPSLAEQTQIAAFLDRETVKIDELVAEQRRLMELLKEKRQAVISHAVTQGLNPKAPMKPSGIEWIGEVPVGWGVVPLKHVCRIESGHTPQKSNEKYWVEEDCSIPWISLNDTKTLAALDFIDDTASKISALGMSNSSAHMIEAGAVVMNRDGARVGLSAITTKPMCVSQHIIAWVCGESVFNQYLLHVLYAMNDEIYRLAGGATIPTIGMGDINEMTMPLPPLNEQKKIVEYLLLERQRFDTLTAEAQRAIDLLQERRTALISAAVTGQIDVRAGGQCV